ncbi:MAG: RcnB family protein, partial [Micavibrio aeruginosavorus]|nr:RcnB family protein [Micavibrio aeruginosavorus]
DLLDLLGPPPRGHQYVQVDKDVLLIGEASKKVIDAVTLLSAVDF